MKSEPLDRKAKPATTPKIAQPADPTITEVLEEFLADQQSRLRPKTLGLYADVLHLLCVHLNDYAHDGLSRPEAVLFERCYNAEGPQHRDFCDLFGPEKISENIWMFLSYFMIRKVMAGPELTRAAGTVTKRLAAWLAKKGYTTEDEGRQVFEQGAAAARDLPRANRAGRLLYEHARRSPFDAAAIDAKDYLEFDHFEIARIEPGQIWFEVRSTGRRSEIGPISVPQAATALLRPAWSISCALGRVGGSWRLVEVANVYPS